MPQLLGDAFETLRWPGPPRELPIAWTDAPHDWLHPPDISEITNSLGIGQAVADLRCTARGVATQTDAVGPDSLSVGQSL